MYIEAFEYNDDLTATTLIMSENLKAKNIQNMPVMKNADPTLIGEYHIEIPLSQFGLSGYAIIDQEELEHYSIELDTLAERQMKASA